MYLYYFTLSFYFSRSPSISSYSDYEVTDKMEGPFLGGC